jgi:hypothetical protein
MVITERLKTVFEIPAITAALSPYMDEDGLPLEIYERLLQKTEILLHKWIELSADSLRTENDGGVLLSMLCAAVMKDVIW